MTKARDRFPVLSPELDFVARHWDDICAIVDGDIHVEEHIRNLTKRVDSRGDKDAKDLIRELSNSILAALRGTARVKWSNNVNNSWQLTGTLYRAFGPKKRMASIGLNITYGVNKPPHIIGWYYPPGGLDGHRRVESMCKNLCDDVYLTDDHPERLPGWGRSLVWLDKPLKPAATFGEVERTICDRTKKFFGVVMQTS